MGPVTRAIGASVGFIAEVTSSSKVAVSTDKNGTSVALVRPRSTPSSDLNEKPGHRRGSDPADYDSDHDSNDSDDDDDDDDETEWKLDEAATEKQPAEKKSYDYKAQPTIASLVSIVLSQSQPPPYSLPTLKQPVILPQRRPGSRGRGFVRAHAPVLDQYGIDQTTFLNFVENFDYAMQASPLLTVVAVSAAAASVVPYWAAQVAGTVTQIAVGMAMEAQRRARGNNYLNQINEKLFMPRGLYAVVMTYVPNATRPVYSQEMDISKLLTGEETQSSGLLGRKISKGQTYGDMELPESAPLIFPGIDDTTQENIQNQSKLKKSGRWMADYQDRRAQARYLHNNPDSRLNLPPDQQPSFRSRLADPNHPAFQGSWPTLISWGKIPPKAVRTQKRRAEREERRMAAREHQNMRREARGLPPLPPKGGDLDGYGRRGRKRRAKSKILYLMILPIPSEAELRASQRKMEQAEMEYSRKH